MIWDKGNEEHGSSYPGMTVPQATGTVPEFGTLNEAVIAPHTVHHGQATPSSPRLPVPAHEQ